MALRSPLKSLITAMGATVLIVAASVLTATAVTALATFSKEFTTVMVVAGVMVAAGLAVLASKDDE